METTMDFINNLDVLTLSIGGISLASIIALIIVAISSSKRKSKVKEANDRIEDLEMVISALQLEADLMTHSAQTLERDERRAKAKKKAPKMKKVKEAPEVVFGQKKRGRKPKSK